LHFADIHFDVVNFNAVIGKMVLGVVVMVTALQEGFGRDATDVQASTTETTTRFDARSLQAQLTGFDGCDIATGAAA
jgi:hypothetical protein